MSTRYVWNRFNINPVVDNNSVTQRNEICDGSPITIGMTTSSDDLSIIDGPRWPMSAQLKTARTTATLELNGYHVVPANTYFAFKGSKDIVYSHALYSGENTITCYASGDGTAYNGVDIHFGRTDAYAVRYNASKGTANGTVSNAASSTYPLNNDQWQITSIYSIPIVLVRRCANV